MKKKRKLGTVTIIVLSVVGTIVLYFLILLSAQMNKFPGNLLSRAVANGRINRYRDEADIEFKQWYNDQDTYWFYYTVNDSDDVCISVANLSVVNDGYYNKYIKDFDSVKKSNDLLLEKFQENWPDNGTKLNQVNNNAEIKKTDNVSIQTAEDCKNILKKNTMTICIYGPECTFDEYKTYVYDAVHMIHELDLVPKKLYVHYFCDDNRGDLLYESTIDRKMFVYNEELLSACKHTHYIVEVDDGLAKKYKAYSIVKIIYNVVIVGIIVVSIILALVKYEKKRRKSI